MSMKTPNDETTSAPLQRRRWRKWLIGLAAITVIAVVLPLLRGPDITKGLGQVVMPDGTILVLRIASTDPKVGLKVPRQLTIGSIRLPIPGHYPEQFGNDKPGTTLVLSRHDAQTGKYLDFKWFGNLEIEDRFGNEHASNSFGLEVRGYQADWATEASTGYVGQCTKDVSPGEEFFLICSLPVLNVSTTATLRVISRDRKEVAVFSVPLPSPPVAKEFQEAKFRTECTAASWDIKLAKISIAGSLNDQDGQYSALHEVYPHFEASYDKSALSPDEWCCSSFLIEDDLGNITNGPGYRFSSTAPVWKISASFRRTASGMQGFSERTPLGTFNLRTGISDEGVSSPITVNGLTMRKLILATPGTETFSVKNSTVGDFLKSATVRKADQIGTFCRGGEKRGTDIPRNGGNGAGSFGKGNGHWGGDSNIDTVLSSDPTKHDLNVNVIAKWDSTLPATMLTIESPMPVLILGLEQWQEGKTLFVFVKDKSGNDVPVHAVIHPIRNMPIYALEVALETTEVSIEVAVETSADAHFFVRSPARNLPPLNKPDDSFDLTAVPVGEDWKMIPRED